MKNQRISIRIDNKLLEDLKLIGLLEGCNTSFIIRTVIQDYVDFYMYRSKKKSDMDEQSNV